MDLQIKIPVLPIAFLPSLLSRERPRLLVLVAASVYIHIEKCRMGTGRILLAVKSVVKFVPNFGLRWKHITFPELARRAMKAQDPYVKNHCPGS